MDTCLWSVDLSDDMVLVIDGETTATLLTCGCSDDAGSARTAAAKRALRLVDDCFLRKPADALTETLY